MDPAAAARQWACQQLAVRFFDLLDAKQYAGLVALFDTDATWLRPGSTLQGRSAILAAMKQRPAHRNTRHLVGNFLVLADRGTEVEARCTLSTFAIDNTFSNGRAARLVEAFTGIYAANVTFGCAADGISILALELAPEIPFERPAG